MVGHSVYSHELNSPENSTHHDHFEDTVDNSDEIEKIKDQVLLSDVNTPLEKKSSDDNDDDDSDNKENHFSSESAGSLAEHEKPKEDNSSDAVKESAGTLAAFGGERDDYNYNYYKNSAESHKDSAQRYERDAADRRDWAERYSNDYPEKARIYLDEARNWSDKANSEWSAYRDDLNKAKSYE